MNEDFMDLSDLSTNTLVESKRFKIGFKWEIEQVHKLLVDANDDGHYLKESELFPTDIEDKLQFRIRIIKTREFVSLCLFLEVSDVTHIKLRCHYMLFDCTDKKIFNSKMKNFTTLARGDSLELENNFEYFVSKSFQTDKFTLYCEIEAIMDKYPNAGSNFVKLYKEAERKTLIDFGTLLKDGKHSDVILSVGGIEFCAHKAILGARSPVFSAMFEHETKENLENRVNISDIKFEVFNDLLKFIYTGKVDSLKTNAAGLFAASDMYQFDELRSITEEWLCLNISSECVVEILQLADMHSAPKLKTAALNYIIKHKNEVLNTEEWKKFTNARLDIFNEVCLHLSDKMEKLFTSFDKSKKMKVK